jgi:hypothetical protein
LTSGGRSEHPAAPEQAMTLDEADRVLGVVADVVTRVGPADVRAERAAQPVGIGPEPEVVRRTAEGRLRRRLERGPVGPAPVHLRRPPHGVGVPDGAPQRRPEPLDVLDELADHEVAAVAPERRVRLGRPGEVGVAEQDLAGGELVARVPRLVEPVDPRAPDPVMEPEVLAGAAEPDRRERPHEAHAGQLAQHVLGERVELRLVLVEEQQHGVDRRVLRAAPCPAERIAGRAVEVAEDALAVRRHHPLAELPREVGLPVAGYAEGGEAGRRERDVEVRPSVVPATALLPVDLVGERQPAQQPLQRLARLARVLDAYEQISRDG